MLNPADSGCENQATHIARYHCKNPAHTNKRYKLTGVLPGLVYRVNSANPG